jgi:hypothetical protein
MPDLRTRTRTDLAWLVTVSVIVILAGMAYSLWWAAVVRHDGSYWVVPGDVWGAVRAAHWIDWGGFSFIYDSRTGLVTLPGFQVLLAPIVAISSHLHLLESAPSLPGPLKPTSWLLIGPLFLACTIVPVFAADALARQLRAAVWARRAVAVGTGAAVWPAIALWGHAEDVLALGLAIYALVALLNGRLGAAGWLLGGALAMQLYVVALAPLFVAVVGRRKAAPLLARAAILPGSLLVAVIVPNFHATVHALLDQPNFPKVDHATPWLLMAPNLGHGAVAAGPGRLIGLVLAVAVGTLGIRYQLDVRRIVWLSAVVLGLRCVFESVMDPYYVMPVIVLTLVVAADAGAFRFLGSMAGGAGLTVLTYFRTDMWAYWFEMTGVMVVILVLAWPARTRRSSSHNGALDVLEQPTRESPSSLAVPA